MSLKKVGDIWHYQFKFENRKYRKSTKTSNRRAAERMEEAHRRELEEGRTGPDPIRERKQLVTDLVTAHYETYKAKGKSVRYVHEPSLSTSENFS